ncbi:BspA family leucine-rich repeat surface protein [Enterovibrio norvegicus]|uniref:BspA family leucine-rich repeat surface protein n=1 Tax=Enterovibrio norvegicus TaxID=188144 RepID=UPI0024681317|nr:BspA family leucine-rich repeat surface protein [Enterovibrio norvegicus]
MCVPVSYEPIGDWQTSKLKGISGMFSGAKQFDQSITEWDFSNVIYADRVFEGNGSIKQYLAQIWIKFKSSDEE